MISSCCLLILQFQTVSAIAAPAPEPLNRGLLAMPVANGVYVGWRLLASDPAEIAFNVYRTEGDAATPRRLNPEPLRTTTDFVDPSPPSPTARYSLRAVSSGHEGPPLATTAVTITPVASSYVSIKLKGDYSPQKVAIADLDGDGQPDYIIKQPNFNTDPFQSPGYWKRSEDTYKIEAYRSDGTFLWRHDLGWSIEEGIWYSPFVVFDLDGDGKAEVYAKAGEGDPRDADGRVTSGPEWLVQIDGLTGEIRHKVPWPDRTGYEDYNWTSRNLMGIACLDGKHASVIVERGTYSQIKVEAFDARLRPVWKWNSREEKQKYTGCGMHGMHVADVDGDGRDEIILGSAVLDDNGHGLWTNPLHNKAMAHPDVCYVADIDPGHPGLEIFYGFETGQPRDGVCLMDARTGKILWSYDGKTSHVHNQGMVGDISARYPGLECYCGEKDGSQYWLYTSSGERISSKELDGLSPPAIYWNADPQKELILKGRVTPYEGEPGQTVEGKVIGISDCLGDWREEVISSLPGELRIYTTTIPAQSRRICLMQDHLYRMDVALASMGYFYPPQLSGQPDAQKARTQEVH